MKLNKYILIAGTVLTFGTVTQSCSLDEPFGTAGDGELRMRMVIDSEVTRAETDADALRSNCVLYISGEKGLLYKWKGLENVPESLTLKSGNYVAEAWTGDSVSASFDKKFYRGYQPFNIQAGVNSVIVNCKLANVVVSINEETIDEELMKDWKVEVANSRASLEFTAENVEQKGYFMMPNADTELVYTITGMTAAGKEFSYKGTIENPERAHEYVLNFKYDPNYEEKGGTFLTIIVDDTEQRINSEVVLYSRPAITGLEFDVDKQITGYPGEFSDRIVKISAFGSLTRLQLNSPDDDVFKLLPNSPNFIGMTDLVEQQLKEAGISFDYQKNEDRNLVSCYITFDKKFFNNLPERPKEYTLTISASDEYGKSNEQTLRIAVGDEAIVIDDPVSLPDEFVSNLLSVKSTMMTLTGEIADSERPNPGIRIREAGTDNEWVTGYAGSEAVMKARSRKLTPAQARRVKGTPFKVTFRNLKPGTRYEVQAVADDFYSESRYITTETVFTIPNASLEDWSSFTDNSQILIPGAGGVRTFWDSGNHGSATLSVTLTQNSGDMFHSGSYSARLRSQFVGITSSIGKFAAGNLFAGEYLETQGSDGRLQFGREYDGSHPDKLRLWANYRPGKVESNGSKGGKLSEGDTDLGQIYVALTTEPVEIRTKQSTRKLFDPEGQEVLAYGEVTWNSNFGPDGSLEKVEIPLTYYDRAKTTRARYLVIVCSASKYGDYFDGGEGSVMYVDDFELVY